MKKQIYAEVTHKQETNNKRNVLDECTLQYLHEWKEVQANLVNTSFVMSYNGIPTQKHTLAYAIDRYSKMVNIHRIKIYALRHSHASLLIQMGENPLIIKERLGHEDIETTLGTYGHLYPNSSFEVATKLNSIVSFNPPRENLDISTKN